MKREKGGWTRGKKDEWQYDLIQRNERHNVSSSFGFSSEHFHSILRSLDEEQSVDEELSLWMRLSIVTGTLVSVQDISLVNTPDSELIQSPVLIRFSLPSN